MAHPFYGDYKAPNWDTHKGLQTFITQAARLSSNERIVNKQQAGAKERLEMEIQSVEKRHARTENRLDTQLADNIKTASQLREHAEDLHPLKMENSAQVTEGLRLSNIYTERTMNDKVELSKLTTDTAKRNYMQLGVDDSYDAFMNSQMISANGLFQTYEENGVTKMKLDAEGLPLLRDDFSLTALNDDQIEDRWEEYMAANENYATSGIANYSDFRDKWVDMEGDQINRIQRQIMTDLHRFMENRGEDAFGPGEIWSALGDIYGEDHPVISELKVAVANDPDSEYFDFTQDPEDDEFGWANTDSALQAQNQFSTYVSPRFDTDDANYNFNNIRHVFGDNKSTNKINKDIISALKVTDEELDHFEFNAHKGSDGIPYVTFWEDDGASIFGDWLDVGGVLNDNWMGRLGADGKVYWQSDEWGSYNWDNDANVFTTEEMLKQTEGAGGADSSQASTIDYKAGY